MFLSETNVGEIITVECRPTQKTSTDCNDMNMSFVKNIIHLVVQHFTYITNIIGLVVRMSVSGYRG